jgi:hypothetical protein
VERRHVENVCAVTREVLRCAEHPKLNKARPIRPTAEVVELHLRKSEGDILLLMARTTKPCRREGPLLWLELIVMRKGR